MFGFSISDEMKQKLRAILNTQVRAWAGLAFMALAMVAIQYDEIVAPEVHRISDGFGSAATDMGRRLASFTL